MLTSYTDALLSCLKEKYMVNFAFYTDEIEQVLHQQYQGEEKPLLFLLHGLNTDSHKFAEPAKFKVLFSLSQYPPPLHFPFGWEKA